MEQQIYTATFHPLDNDWILHLKSNTKNYVMVPLGMNYRFETEEKALLHVEFINLLVENNRSLELTRVETLGLFNNKLESSWLRKKVLDLLFKSRYPKNLEVSHVKRSIGL